LFSAKIKVWFLSLQLFATVIILKKKRNALTALERTAEKILTVQMTGGGKHL
jgi:uncharacterized membrane protein YsdA (DUF1294 family)